MKKKILQSMVAFLLLVSTIQINACGTLMYPERRGQRQGEIDIKVAVLDGIGLFFCVIPGVIAYIVDFTTGAIYLPAGKRNMVNINSSDMRVIYVDKDKINNPSYIHQVVNRELISSTAINWDNIITYKMPRNTLPEFAVLHLNSLSK